jgi:YggT family protein
MQKVYLGGGGINVAGRPQRPTTRLVRHVHAVANQNDGDGINYTSSGKSSSGGVGGNNKKSGLLARFHATLQRTVAGVNEEVNREVRRSAATMRTLVLVAPFAAVSGSADTFFIITKAVASFIKLYLLLLFVRVLLSWFPTFTWWETQPWLALRQVTDPYLKLFSGLVPPLLGTIDLTPLFGFFILQFLAGALDVADEETRFWS